MSLPTIMHNWPWLVAGAVGALSGFVAYCNVPLAWKGTPQKATLGKTISISFFYVSEPELVR